jgi:hypothetical protein
VIFIFIQIYGGLPHQAAVSFISEYPPLTVLSVHIPKNNPANPFLTIFYPVLACFAPFYPLTNAYPI